MCTSLVLHILQCKLFTFTSMYFHVAVVVQTFSLSILKVENTYQ